MGLLFIYSLLKYKTFEDDYCLECVGAVFTYRVSTQGGGDKLISLIIDECRPHSQHTYGHRAILKAHTHTPILTGLRLRLLL